MPYPTRRRRAPRRFYFRESYEAEIHLKDAINDRKLAAMARTDFERRYHRTNMRFAAQNAVAACRRYLRQHYGDEHV